MSRPASLTIPASDRRAGAGGMRQRLSWCHPGRARTVIFRQPPAISGNRCGVSGRDRSGQPEYGSKLAGHGICLVQMRTACSDAPGLSRWLPAGTGGRVMAGPARAMGITRHGRVIPHSGAAWVTTRGAGRGSRTGRCPPRRASPGSGRADAGPGVACAQSAPARCIAARVSSGRWSRSRSGRSRRRSGASS